MSFWNSIKPRANSANGKIRVILRQIIHLTAANLLIKMIEKHVVSPNPESWLEEVASEINADIFRSDGTDDSTMVLPKDLGIGKTRLIKLADGFVVLTSEFRFIKPISFVREKTVNNDFYVFYLDISEKQTVHEMDISCTGESRTLPYGTVLQNKTEKAIQVFSSSIAGRVIPAVGINHSCVYLVISKNWLLAHLDEEKLPRDHPVVKDILGDIPFFLHEDIRSEELVHVTSILKGNRPGYLEKMAIKSHALALVYLILERMLGRQKFTSRGMNISDIEGILRAKDILQSRHDVCPSIGELSRIAVMSPTKFKKLFKKIFGMGCYQYFQKERFKYAVSLLDSGRYCVSEVAAKIGYSNMGQFAKVFRQHYGVTPSQYLYGIN